MAHRLYAPPPGWLDPESAESKQGVQTGLWDVGARVGERYVISGCVGESSAASLYRAEDLFTRKTVAVKALSAGHNQQRALRTRFLVDNKTAMKIEHPNVVRVHYCGLNEQQPFAVMDLVEGEPLSALLDREGRLPADAAMVLFRHAAHGLMACHRAGLVPRSITPNDLLLVGTLGESFALKIGSYGLSPDAPAASNLPGGGVAVAEYMAPEQVLNEMVDGRADVYALGLVMFRTLTGESPFGGPDPSSFLAHQLFSDTPPPSWLVDDFDAPIDRIVKNATRKHPENRYGSMKDMLADIERVLGVASGEVDVQPLARKPDRYLPTGPVGRMIADELHERLWQRGTR